MVDEEWTKDAMTDDSVAALMLLRLKQARTRSLLPPPPAPTKPALHLDWTVRQRRSKSAPRHGDGKRKAEPARASPTTPLSWSGATSASGGALDGFEESSQPDKPTDGSRSKVRRAVFLSVLLFMCSVSGPRFGCKRGCADWRNISIRVSHGLTLFELTGTPI